MNGSFHSSWQLRWAGLADRLERALENNAYRFVLCGATALLVVAYAGFASRMAEPSRFRENRFVQIEDEWARSEKLGVRDVDALNRALGRIEQLASVLDLKPQRLMIRPSMGAVRTPFAIENHVLRLWLDEARGFSSGGMYDLSSEAIASAILAVVFPISPKTAKIPAADSNWYGHVRSLHETCSDRRALPAAWAGLCQVLANTKKRAEAGSGAGASPLSLSGWLTSQIIAEGQALSLGKRIEYLRRLVKVSADPELVKLERADQWPKEARDYGAILRMMISKIAPERVRTTNFNPVVPWFQARLDAKRDLTASIKGLHVGLLVVTSCEIPRLSDFKGFVAREVVWARVCAHGFSAITSLVPSNTAQEFAEKNPDASFAQLGVQEIRLALEKGWIDSKTDITEFVVASRDPRSTTVAAQLRPQKEDWDAKAQAFRVKAPIEVLKLLRLRPI